MDDISDLRLEPLTESRFIRPVRLRYKQDKKEKLWDIIRSHSAVCVVIYNTDSKKMVFVKQFRPAVYFAALKTKQEKEPEPGMNLDTSRCPPSAGLTIEVCAGIVDKDKPVAEIAREEVLEECGYDVPLASLEAITRSLMSVGTGGESMSMFYAEVTDAMRKGQGGGLADEGEMIDVVEMDVAEVRAYVARKEVNTTPSTLFGIMWFLANKCG